MLSTFIYDVVKVLHEMNVTTLQKFFLFQSINESDEVKARLDVSILVECVFKLGMIGIHTITFKIIATICISVILLSKRFQTLPHIFKPIIGN